MADGSDTLARLTAHVSPEQLADWLRDQRWFASKSQPLTSAELIEQVELPGGLHIALAEARFATGHSELYQLVLAQAGPDAGPDAGELTLDAATEPDHARALLRAIHDGVELEGTLGNVSFRHAAGTEIPDPAAAYDEPVRAIGLEQSNTSVVFGDRVVLKLFRKLDAGINPDLEMVRFLTTAGFANIAPLYGWYEYEGEALAATLGIAQRFVSGGRDGWVLALDEIPAAPDRFLDRLSSLGTVTAQMHNTLAGGLSDPAFSPEEPSAESLGLLAASIDEAFERGFSQLPPDDPRLAPIIDRAQEIRDRVSMRPQLRGGRYIRIHGDYHLGQTLATDAGWVLIDFEGEPARPLTQRRMKRSPLRDVASMLRSFAYATSAVALQRHQTAPSGFEDRARKRFLDAYLAEIDQALLPAGEAQIQSLLSLFELEKALYELQYELDNRPDWVAIPVAGITRLLDS